MLFQVEDVCPETGDVRGAFFDQFAQMVLGQDIDGEMVFVDVDVVVPFDPFHQGPFDFVSGEVLVVEDAVFAVSSLAVQIVAARSVLIEFRTPLNELFDDGRGILHDLFYGSGPDLRKFRLNRRDKIEGEAEDRSRSFPGALIGIISQDPVKKHRWVISNGGSEVPISFAGNIAPSDVPLFAKSGPLIASGMVMVDDDGRVSELRSIIGCYSFPNVKFHRVISAERDIPLLNPLEATPGYDQHKGLWTLSNDDLGISVSKPSWDACVMSFHEYFVFLWETYAESDDEFEGEEQEIRELLLSMIPVTAE